MRADGRRWTMLVTMALAAGWPALAQGSGERAEVAPAGAGQETTRIASSGLEDALDEEGEAAERAASANRRRPVVYTPPARGAPQVRRGGGTRSASGQLELHALAPSHVAWTLQAAPTLFWHIDALPPESTTIQFTLIDDDELSIDPVAEFELPLPTAPGIQRVSLADHGVQLKPGVDYEWSIAVVFDPNRRSYDVVSRGWMRLVEVPGLDPGASPDELAARSLWYDALESLTAAIDAAPADDGLREQRNALLRQVELSAAVE